MTFISLVWSQGSVSHPLNVSLLLNLLHVPDGTTETLAADASVSCPPVSRLLCLEASMYCRIFSTLLLFVSSTLHVGKE